MSINSDSQTLFNRFCANFLTSPIHYDVNSYDTKFGLIIFNSLAVIPINVCQNQNKSESKRVLNNTDVQDLPVRVVTVV